MQPPLVVFNPEDIRRLRSATSKLLERADVELQNNKSDLMESGIFGRAAPALTLATLAKLLVALAQVSDDQAVREPELPLSDADLALVEGFLHRARKRERQQELLPANPAL